MTIRLLPMQRFIYHTQLLPIWLPHNRKHPSMAAISTTARPSFFKPLILHFSTRLSLPDVFVRKYRESMPENMKLRIGTGRTWDVKVEEVNGGGGEWYFTAGWKEFVKDLELKEMQMLVFWLNVGEATFDVSVYATNTCEMETSELMANHRLLLTDGDAIESGNESRPRFEFVLNESRKSRIVVYKSFAEAAGLVGKRSVVLQYPPEERYWSALLGQRPPPRYTLEIGIGWNDFRIQNGLVIGRKYSLEFDPKKNVILIKDMKKK